MTCPQCRHENEAGAKFCEECAAPLARACAKCGRPLSPTAKFCPECAHPTGSSAAPVPAQRFDSPESHIPRHLAEKILTSKSALEGERKQVTVLFADLKGSMELLADRDPEEARKLLDPVLERMMEAVHHYEGTVNQVMGDGIMALFGAPIAHEDHALRACYAALRMQRRITLYADELQRAGSTPVQIRVGLNSGEVVVRAIGSDLHMDYSAVGQTTHLAARMEQIAKPGTVLVTGNIRKLVEGQVQVTPVGEVRVKGLETPTTVYELTGTVPARSRLQAGAARGLTHFVGRDSEVQQLAQALERAARGHGQAVAVVGEAGVGKSRLVWEFTRSPRTQGWLVLESSSASYGRATPYLPIIDLLKGYFRIQERDDTRVIRERVAGKLLMLDRTLEPLLIPLLALLDIAVQDAAWDILDPPQRRQRMLEAVKRVLLRESHVQPLLLLFEDLHWIDAETQAFLDSLMDSVPTARVLLLVNYRPEYQHAWGSKTYYLQLRIDPLAPESADVMLDTLLGKGPALESIKRVLIERTEGNPFFLEESVQTLVETHVLVGERGTYRLTKAPEWYQVPATAQAMLAARIDRLSPNAKRLLQTAAVIGKNIPFALLRAIADVPEDSLRRELSRLQGAEFLYETSLFPDLEYTFKHAFTHEVALGSVLQNRRRALHAQIFDAMEDLYAERMTEHVEQLAHHAVHGHVWTKATTFLAQAGAKALARSANREAATCFEQALTVLVHLPESREKQEQAIDIRFALRHALFPLGELSRVIGYLEEAERLATALDDAPRRGWAFVYLSHYTWMAGHLAQSRQWAEQATAIADRVGHRPLQVAATYYLGQACLYEGEYVRAEDLLRTVVGWCADDLNRDRCGLSGFPTVMARGGLAVGLAERGAFPEALAQAEEGIRIAEELDHPYSLIVMYMNVGHVHTTQGNFENAIRILDRSLMLSREWKIGAFVPLAQWLLGSALALSGREADAISALQQSVTTLESIGMALYFPLALTDLGQAYLLAARREDAVATVKRAISLTHEQGQRWYEARATYLLAKIADYEIPAAVDMVEAKYAETLNLATELKVRPLVAHCHLGLGKLYRRTGDGAKAAEHLTTATTMYREMDMGFWLEKADAELRGVER